MFYDKHNKETKLYDILELSTTCDINDIKRSYKKLARKYHPDRNKGTEEKFKEISHAYSILGDTKKKDLYDTYGEDGMNTEQPNMDPFSMFGGLFNMNNRQSNKTQDRLEDIYIGLDDLYNEKSVKLSYIKKQICTSCNGLGVQDIKKVHTCNKCNGKGVHIKIVQVAPGFISQSQESCWDCNGTGKIYEQNNKCIKCNGNKIIDFNNQLKIKIKKYFNNGHTVVFKGQADQSPGIELFGDLIVKINFKPHKEFKIYLNKHLLFEKNITLVDALCGVKFKITHLDGSVLFINHEKIIQPMEQKKINGLGLTGDLIINFNIIFPNEIDEERKVYIKKLFEKYNTTNVVIQNKNDIYCKLHSFKTDEQPRHKQDSPIHDEPSECVHQ